MKASILYFKYEYKIYAILIFVCTFDLFKIKGNDGIISCLPTYKCKDFNDFLVCYDMALACSSWWLKRQSSVCPNQSSKKDTPYMLNDWNKTGTYPKDSVGDVLSVSIWFFCPFVT